MSIHYAKYAKSEIRVEYIGRKPRDECIETIDLGEDNHNVLTLSFSPDGTQILSHLERGVYVWDATGGKLISGPLLTEDDVFSAAYLPDGRSIIVDSGNGIIKKWDVLTNCLVSERVMNDFEVYSAWAVSVAFSPDRNSVAFGYNQGRIRVWNADTGEQYGGWLEGHTDYVNCLSFSPDGKYLASGSYDTTIVIWDMDKRGALTRPLKKHTQRVTAVDFSSCGANLVSGSSDETILVSNIFTGEMLREIACKSEVYSVRYSPNGLFILAGGKKWMSMWHAADDRVAPKVFQVNRDIEQVSFSSDSSRIVSVSGNRGFYTDNRLIEIWDASWSVEETQPAFEKIPISSISLSPGGKYIVSGSYKRSIYLWNVLTGEPVKKLKFSECGVLSVAFSPINEQLIAFGLRNGIVQVWDVTNDEPITIGNHADEASSIAFSPSDGKHVASGSYDKTIRIWKVEGGESVVGPLIGHKHSVRTVTYSPDGTRLVSGSTDKTIRIWNSETGDLLSILNGHSDSVNSVAYSFDGSRIVSGSEDNTILVWDAQTGQIVCEPIKGHDDWVDSVCFSPDGKRILSGSGDQTARVWDAITGNPLFPPFTGHAHFTTSVCFFPDGRHFVTGSLDSAIRIWSLDEFPIDSYWELRNDNWVVGGNGKLMMWIPRDLHRYLCHHRNIRVFNRSFHLKLHLDTE